MKCFITGASGFFGQGFARLLLDRGAERVVFYSRSESRQADVAMRFAADDATRFFLGDVRDRERLEEAMWGCDTVVHAAALKRVDAVAYDPGEVRKTNVVGSACVVAAGIALGVKKILMISSDKAVAPQNAYGVSKAQMEHEAIAMNAISYPRGTRISCTRWGNVLGSTGSVVGVWREQLRRGLPLTITDPAMTRFIITLQQAAAFCLAALEDMEGGEVFVPRLPAARVADLADAVENEWYARRTTKGEPCWSREITGLRPGGEKLHEALLTREEPTRTWWDGGRMVILPSHHSWREDWKLPEGQKVAGPYTSDAPDQWLGVEELVAMLKEVP